MFKAVVVMLESAARVVRGIDKDALDLAGELLFQRLEGEEIVAEDEAVIEEIVVRNAMFGVMGLLGVLQQDARLQPWPVLLPDPSQFEFCFFGHCG